MSMTLAMATQPRGTSTYLNPSPVFSLSSLLLLVAAAGEGQEEVEGRAGQHLEAGRGDN